MNFPRGAARGIARAAVFLACGLLGSCRTQSPSRLSEGLPSLPDFPSARYFYDAPDAPPLISAHRAQPELPGYAENALPSIERLVSSGSFVIEMDVALSRDSVLFLFHDDELDRLTRNSGRIEEHAWSTLDTMRLLDADGRLTEATIPTLAEALAAVDGRALVTLDRKAGVSYRQLYDELLAAGVEEHVALILYDEDDLQEWARLPAAGPVSFGGGSVAELEAARQTADDLAAYLGTYAYRRSGPVPLLAFVGVGPPDTTLLTRAANLGIRTIVGTFGELDAAAAADGGQTYRDLVDRGVDVIATDRPLAAYAALADRYRAAVTPVGDAP